MAMNNTTSRPSLRFSATLLLVGQLLYIVVTQLHADGDANNHPAVFAEYARSGIWTAVHLGQFAGMTILLAGLLALFFALDARPEGASWAGRFGAASAVATLALYGVLQAVDGVALKHAVDAWASAPDPEKGGALRERRGDPLAGVGREELPERRAGLRVAPARDRGPAGASGAGAHGRRHGPLRPRLPGAGLGGRVPGLLPNGERRDRARLRPRPGVDGLAGRDREANAR